MAGADADSEAVLVEETRRGKFQVEAHVADATILIDEPVAFGGMGSGPTPYDMLSTALGACTAMTIRLYADRKGMAVERVRVRVKHHRGTLQARDRFEKFILIDGALTAEQRADLLRVAQRCPVHITLDRGADVDTHLIDNKDYPGQAPNGIGEHARNMSEASA
jgi:putative redox protein